MSTSAAINDDPFPFFTNVPTIDIPMGKYLKKKFEGTGRKMLSATPDEVKEAYDAVLADLQAEGRGRLG